VQRHSTSGEGAVSGDLLTTQPGRDAFDEEMRRQNQAVREKRSADERREGLAIQFARDMLRAGATDMDIVELQAWKLAGLFVPRPFSPTEEAAKDDS
jgi:hypothetical protein